MLTVKSDVDVTQSDVSPEFRGDQFFRQGSVGAGDHGFGHVPTGAQYGYCKTREKKRYFFSNRTLAKTTSSYITSGFPGDLGKAKASFQNYH